MRREWRQSQPHKLIIRLSNRMTVKTESLFCVCSCCNRFMRYPSEQAGISVICPGCSSPVTFPFSNLVKLKAASLPTEEEAIASIGQQRGSAREPRFCNFVFLRDFDTELTCDHNALMCKNPRVFEDVCRRVQKTSGLAPTTKLHRNDVLLLSHVVETSGMASSLEDLLRELGFASQGSARVFRTSTTTPIEDGFFSCLCIRNAGLAVPDEESSGKKTLKWQEQKTPAEDSLGQLLAAFIKDELQRVDQPSCMHFLDDLYGTALKSPERNQLLMSFDTEYAYVEFAASPWSKDELRFWSRPVMYPP
jgi:hypothetical protein